MAAFLLPVGGERTGMVVATLIDRAQRVADLQKRRGPYWNHVLGETVSGLSLGSESPSRVCL